jgi:hypothetical protein
MSIDKVGVSKIEYQGAQAVLMTDMPVSPACRNCPLENITFKRNQLLCNQKKRLFLGVLEDLEMYGRILYRHPTPCGLTQRLLLLVGKNLEDQPINPGNGFPLSSLVK